MKPRAKNSRRPRVARRALGASRRAPVSGSSRERIAMALDSCTSDERALLSLVLLERMTPLEAGASLGLSERELSRTYTNLLAELRRTLRGTKFRPASRTLSPAGESLERAS